MSRGSPRRGGHTRRRRPVGEPPPLPRDFHGAAILWIGVTLVLTLGYVWGRSSPAAGELQRTVDGAVGDWAAEARSTWASWTSGTSDQQAWWWLLVGLRWGVVVALIVFRRWRHLAVFVASIVVVSVLARWFPTAGLEGTGIPDHPSTAIAALGVTMLGVIYGLAPPGRWRRTATAITGLMCATLALILLLSGTNTLSEIAIGFAGGIAIPFLGYRIFAPESVFPITYHRGRTAHLDVEGRRGEAIRRAISDQLGVDASSVEPFGLGGSGGSTPLRIEMADGGHWFGKLYAINHLRADRWYKLGRSILYGALEDERSFNSVRRMVEYEDHMLRYLRDHGVPTAEPIGFVELTPEREYLLVTSFIEGGVELNDARMDDQVIASGVRVVRALWDAGVAHRDMKPANMLVRDGQVILIDDFFCQVRPSPWRQSVDLANMLLTLALGTEVRQVYEAALFEFTDDEIAEAFAATKGVTIPSQLRAMTARDDRDLVREFRSLAPARRSIPVQRWTMRRLALTSALLMSLAIVISATIENLGEAGFGP
jgi:tRNA A-37 threonylcarbamoyl transferase component Bud32